MLTDSDLNPLLRLCTFSILQHKPKVNTLTRWEVALRRYPLRNFAFAQPSPLISKHFLALISFTANMSPVFRCLIVLCIAFSSHAWTPVVVKNVTLLGPQLSPDVTVVSRDGGYSVLIDGKIVWLYDDTECKDLQGNQLSFISNTATYQLDPKNVSTVTDFGVVDLGKTSGGSSKSAILAGTTVGTGGWIPFQSDELDFNRQMVGKERVAICKHSARTVWSSPHLWPAFRAWHLPYTNQYYSGISLRTTSLRRLQASRPHQGVSSKRNDFDSNHCSGFWSCCNAPR